MNDFDSSGFVFVEAARDVDAERHAEQLVRGKLAAAGLWPYLAEAVSETEFGHRLALVEDRLAELVPADVLEPVQASLAADWKLLHTARLQQHQAAAQGRGEVIRTTAARVHSEQIGPAQEFFDQQARRWVTAANSASGYTLPDRYQLPEDLRANQHATEGYRDARYHAANGYDWRLGDADSFTLQHGDYQQGYARGHDDLKRRAYIDPSDAQRYSAYPGQYGQVDNGPLQGPDGFVTDPQPDNSGASNAVIEQRQLTPGQWTVTPGTEWPVRPNAADPTQVPRTASGPYTHNSDVFPASGPGVPRSWVKYNDVGGIDASIPHARMMEIVANPQNGWSAELDTSNPLNEVVHATGPEGTYHRYDAYPSKRVRVGSHHRHAGEGIVPTPGPNPNYFSQGSDGLAGPPSFPQNPSGQIEPKTDNRMDDLYGAVPPQISSGSVEGYADPSQGYSRQAPGASATASRHPFGDGRVAAISTPCQTPEVNYDTVINDHTIGVTAEMPYSVNLDGQQAKTLDGDLHNMMEMVLAPLFSSPPYNPPHQEVDHSSPNHRSHISAANLTMIAEGQVTHKPRIAADGSGGYTANCVGPNCGWHQIGFKTRQAAGKAYTVHKKQPSKTKTAGGFGGTEPTFKSGDSVVDSRGDGATIHRVIPSRDPGKSHRVQVRWDDPERNLTWDGKEHPEGAGDQQAYYEHVFTHRPEAVSEMGRMVDQAVPHSQDIQRAYSSRRQAAELTIRRIQDAAMRHPDLADKHCGSGGLSGASAHQLQAMVEEAERRDQGDWGPEYTAARLAATDGRIVGHCDHCRNPVRYHTNEDGADELRHLHNNDNRCSTGQRATASLNRIYAFYDPADPSVQTLRVQADDTTRMRPSLDHPSGVSDEFVANTWDTALTQRPLQSAQDRHINTPTQPRDPIPTIESSPRDNDLDENQNPMSRETSLRSVEQIMEMS